MAWWSMKFENHEVSRSNPDKVPLPSDFFVSVLVLPSLGGQVYLVPVAGGR